MKRYLLPLGILAVITVVVNACCDDHVGVTPRPLTLNQSSLDQMDPAERLGRVLFYDTRLSVNNSISCASCHKQAFGFSDNKTFSTGFQNEAARRNTIAIADRRLVGSPGGGFGFPVFWDGREMDLSSMVLQPVFNHAEMGMDDGEDLVDRIRSAGYYHELFREAFNNSEIDLMKIGSALSVFVSTMLFSSDFRAQHPDRMTPSELAGKNLFDNKFQCNSCHKEANMYGVISDPFANIGLEMNYADAGRAEVTNNQSDHGKFKIPSLTNVALTAPYMHDGRFENLDQVLNHYSQGIQPHQNLSPALKDASGNPVHMNMTSQEKESLKAYLNAFTSVNSITNPLYSDPFN